MPYFHRCPADSDPQKLLAPENQVSTPWGAHDHGPCDKCEGGGRVAYRCLSCIEEGSDPHCPACAGRVEFVERCPGCAGGGEITDTVRAGISVFPSLAGLYRYLAEREADLDRDVIVELDGRLSDDRDLDAERGALLLHPTRVIAVHPPDPGRLADRRARLRSAG